MILKGKTTNRKMIFEDDILISGMSKNFFLINQRGHLRSIVFCVKYYKFPVFGDVIEFIKKNYPGIYKNIELYED